MEKQKTAVINTILSTLKSRGVDYELNGETSMNEVLTSDDKAKCRAILLEGFMSGDIEMSDQAREKYNDESSMKTYVSGVLNNWIKKHPPFNNGQKYVPVNKGSRAGSGDEQIRELRKLLKLTNDPQATAEINQAIQDRLAEIKPSAVVEINVDALPEHLKHLAK